MKGKGSVERERGKEKGTYSATLEVVIVALLAVGGDIGVGNGVVGGDGRRDDKGGRGGEEEGCELHC
jgi:hypothetical protein